MISFLLLLALLAAAQLVWLKLYIPYEVRHDAKKIAEDGSKDSLKGRWHRLGALKNGVAAGLLCFGFTFWHWSIAAALWLVLMSLFWISFDRGLNHERNLPWNYVGENGGIDKWYRKRYGLHAPETMQRHKKWLLGVGYLLLGIAVAVALTR